MSEIMYPYTPDVQPDTTGSKLVKVKINVTRPNFRKALRDKVAMKVRVTPALSEELQKIAREEGV